MTLRITYEKAKDEWKYKDGDKAAVKLADKYKNKTVNEIEKELKKDGKKVK